MSLASFSLTFQFVLTVSLPLQLRAQADTTFTTPIPQRRGFLIEYTLITANSPDCEPSLADSYSVRVQYRLTHPSTRQRNAEAPSNQNRAGPWRDSPFNAASVTAPETGENDSKCTNELFNGEAMCRLSSRTQCYILPTCTSALIRSSISIRFTLGSICDITNKININLSSSYFYVHRL